VTWYSGISLDDYYKSNEWDLLAVRAQKYEKYYPCCSQPYPDIKFNITIRRKTLFYTVNLILPCVVICSVTLCLFYMPAQSGEKITMGMTLIKGLIRVNKISRRIFRKFQDPLSFIGGVIVN